MVDPVLSHVRTAIDRAFGPRVERVVLFGSRARGDGMPESDYDVAVFLRDLDDRWGAMDRLADLATDLLDRTGEVVHAIPFPAGAWAERTPLMHELRRDGRDL
ncbi:MAG: hypothetical protein RLY86_724 [Pseudomonadota bacterium]|jgi:predicted nucleotidyltransferase